MSRAAPRAWLPLTMALAASPALAGSRQADVGLEDFYYRTAITPLNRGNVLGLDEDEHLLRAVLHWKETAGPARGVFSGYVQQRIGGVGAGTDWKLREAYAQYGWGQAVSLRVGKQRIAWGSGFAWNPTSRLEPPKNPINTGLEQEGAWAARLDWIPAPWAGVIVVGARTGTAVGDLPFSTPETVRHGLAVRARFLVRDTDLALVVSGGEHQTTLLGFDVGRTFGALAAHAEGAVYSGSELRRPVFSLGEPTSFRVAVGGLRTFGQSTSVALEYFYNGEGYRAPERDAFLAVLDRSYTVAVDPAATERQRQAALLAYVEGSAAPFAGGLGLRRHYLHAAVTRSEAGGRWTASLRSLFGLSDGGAALTPGVAWSPRGNLTINLDGVLLLGPEKSEYRLAPLRRALQARLRFLF